MHLISKATANIPMPSVLPTELLDLKRKDTHDFPPFESTAPHLANQLMSPTLSSEINYKNVINFDL